MALVGRRRSCRGGPEGQPAAKAVMVAFNVFFFYIRYHFSGTLELISIRSNHKKNSLSALKFSCPLLESAYFYLYEWSQLLSNYYLTLLNSYLWEYSQMDQVRCKYKGSIGALSSFGELELHSSGSGGPAVPVATALPFRGPHGHSPGSLPCSADPSGHVRVHSAGD